MLVPMCECTCIATNVVDLTHFSIDILTHSLNPLLSIHPSQSTLSIYNRFSTPGVCHRLTSVVKAMMGLICKEPLYRESVLTASTIVNHNDLLIAAFTHTDTTGGKDGGGGSRGGGANGFGYPPSVATTTATTTTTTATTRYELTAAMDAAYSLLIRNALVPFKTAGIMMPALALALILSTHPCPLNPS